MLILTGSWLIAMDLATPTQDAITAVGRYDLEALARAVRDGADLNSVCWARGVYDKPWGVVCTVSLACAAAIVPRPKWADHLALSLLPNYAESVVKYGLCDLRVGSKLFRLIVSALLATGIASNDNLAAAGVHAAKDREIDVDCLTPAGVAVALIELRDINTMYVATLPRLSGGDPRCLKSVVAYGFGHGYGSTYPILRKWLADLAAQLGAPTDWLAAQPGDPTDMAARAALSSRVDDWRNADDAAADAAVEVVGVAICNPLAREFAPLTTPKGFMWPPHFAAIGVAAWHAGYLESREAALGALRFCD
jgi:hypothetical protein